MRETIVLIREQTPYGLDVSGGHKVEKLSTTYVSQYHDRLFVTSQVFDFLHIMPFEDSLFPDILDFECLDREVRQSFMTVDSGWHWTEQDMLKTYLGVEKELWQENEMEELMELFRQCYLKMKEKGKTEWNRIEQIELPLNRVLYKEQRRGLHYDIPSARNICEELHRTIYRLKNNIQIEYGIVTPDYGSFARKFSLPLAEPSHHELKYYAQKHPELASYRELEKVERDYNALMFAAASNKQHNTSYPIYKGFASSTGRIFLRDPALQNIRRRYRQLLIDPAAIANYKYVYLDYSQFEAGVIAGLTENQKLKALYNKGGIYDNLASVARVDRDTAKTYFYCFVYGDFAVEGTETFFEEFCSKSQLDGTVGQYIANGYVETILGNRKIIPHDTDETPKWVLNHLVQGTASLIFKQAVIDTSNMLYPDERLLLPMHDGALYLLRNTHDTKSLINAYIGAFIKWIPNLVPMVKEKNFFEE